MDATTVDALMPPSGGPRAPRALRRLASAWRLLLPALAVALAFALLDRLIVGLLDSRTTLAVSLEVAAATALGVAIGWLVVVRPLLAEVLRERQEADTQRAQIEANVRHQTFTSQVVRALDMAGDEDAVHGVTERALRTISAGQDAALLLADSSEAHLKRVLRLVDSGQAACTVVSPGDCPALRRAQTQVFASTDDLDACPHLTATAGPHSAVCVPVSVGGRSIGVLLTASRPGEPPSDEHLADLRLIATQAGSRIGMLRVMSATTLQAATDPLTGLLNRRSLEARVEELTATHADFSFVMADLDHFKRLNDTHGHDAGDRALRLFARIAVRVLRSEDVVCRYGGEEFVIVLPETTTSEAVSAMERLQQELLVELSSGTVPGFTASFGVTHSDDARGLEDLCRHADAALFRAKREGRDRVVADGRVAPPRDWSAPPVPAPD